MNFYFSIFNEYIVGFFDSILIAFIHVEEILLQCPNLIVLVGIMDEKRQNQNYNGRQNFIHCVRLFIKVSCFHPADQFGDNYCSSIIFQLKVLEKTKI